MISDNGFWKKDGRLRERGFWTICGLVVGGLALSIGAPFTLLAGSGHHGEAVGYVTSVDQQYNATWDSMVVGLKTDIEATTETRWCTDDETDIRELKFAAHHHIRVVIRYSNSFPLWRWQCNGGISIITSVDSLPVEGGP
jgi:hypothetical protein